MTELRFFSVGCTVRILSTASEYMLGGEELVTVKFSKSLKEKVYTVEWLGRFSLRVSHNGFNMFFAKEDVAVVDN